MKNILTIIFCALTGSILEAQTGIQPMEGTISYITTQHVYVKFESTKNLAPGDTLFMKQDDQWVAVLKVINLSSISCVCDLLSTLKLAVGIKVGSGQKASHAEVPKKIPDQPVTHQVAQKTDTVTVQKAIYKKTRQDIHGRLSIASYSGFSNTLAGNTEKMQYTFSLNAKNIDGSKLSAESYVTFVHLNKQWDKVKANIFNGLKIYNLSLAYDIDSNSRLIFGRKINPKFSNMGAVDGLQYELKMKSITGGIIAGFRPDFSNYGFNSSLFQYGGFLYQEHNVKNGSFQNTLAFIEQNNGGRTDRRFAYFQHSNSLMANLYFFGSLECDVYKKVLNVADSTYKQNNSPRISNLYLSLRYRAMPSLSLYLSYSVRQNIMYYETYKTFLDKILESAAQQGYMLQVNYRPVNRLTIGITTGYRFQKNDARGSKNIYGYLNYLVPDVNMNTTASITWMDASYITGKIYSLGLSRDLAHGIFDAGINYRYVDYRYHQNESPMVQHIAEINLTWRIARKLYLTMYFEGTFEKPNNKYERLYVQLNKSF